MQWLDYLVMEIHLFFVILQEFVRLFFGEIPGFPDAKAAEGVWGSVVRVTGLMDEAVRHRIDADQVEHAVALVERYAQEMHVRGDFQTIAAVLRRLPPQALSRSLQLRLLHGQLQWRAGHLDAYAEILDDLERDTPPIERVICSIAAAVWLIDAERSSVSALTCLIDAVISVIALLTSSAVAANRRTMRTLLR